LLHAATVLENEIRILSLNRESRNHALIRLAEVINTHVEVKRVVFDDWRVNRGSKVVELNLRWPRQVSEDLQTRERAVLLALIVPHANAAKVRDAIGLVRQTHLFGQRQTGARHVQQSVLFIRVASDAVFTTARWVDEFDLNS